jgi:3',5'-cyclic AMP phosphodiesterase CpdA
MARLAWATDIHLNFLGRKQVRAFLSRVEEQAFDALLLSGDLSDGRQLPGHLRMIEDQISRPVYFVLGNHDYYHSSFEKVHVKLRPYCQPERRVRFLGNGEVIPVGADTVLVGTSGWADGRYGRYASSQVVLNDHLHIQDFARLGYEGQSWIGALARKLGLPWSAPPGLAQRRQKILTLMNRLGDAAAAYVELVLFRALAGAGTVILLTHVPPFAEACLPQGKPPKPTMLPFYSCKVLGDTLLRIAERFPSKKLLVLCGHTHGPTRVKIRPNLEVRVGAAEYHKPDLEDFLEVV